MNATQTAPHRRQVSPWLIAPIVAMAAFMEVLDLSIANVALPHIAGSLSATFDESTWVLTSYLVTNAIVLPLTGWMSETFGRKRFFIFAIIGFTISSLLCGLATSLGMLVLFRALQGATGGGLQPVSQAILADAFPPAKRGMAFAMYGIAVVLAPAIGPTVGGWITDHMSWRWVFLINLPIGIILTLLTLAFVHDTEAMKEAKQRRKESGRGVDYIGFALLALGLGALQVVLDRGQNDDWFDSNFIVTLSVLVVISLTWFVVRGWRQKEPIVDLHLFKNANFATSNIMMFLLGFVLLGSTQLIPQFVEQLLGWDATTAGLVLSPGGFAILLSMPIVGKLVGKVDPRYLIVFGLAVSGTALLHMTNFNLSVDYPTVAWARVYQAFGLGFLFIPINTVAYAGIPDNKNNQVSAWINLSRNIGGSFGISLVQTTLARRSQFHQSVMASNLTPFDVQYHEFIQKASGALGQALHGVASSTQAAQELLYGMMRQQATMMAFIDDFWLLGLLFLALIPTVLLTRKVDVTQEAPQGH